MPYLLFSQMKIAGSFHSLAMLNASKTWPWFDAPSPYITCATLRLPLCLSASASPAPSGICAPTMPFPPKKFGRYMCIEPPLPREHPAWRPNSSANTATSDAPRACMLLWSR
eukprot:Amastigsp_a511528_83.p4 type:complete len:112 gc:universal Amastigsp_a511528_83:700-365(-)